MSVTAVACWSKTTSFACAAPVCVGRAGLFHCGDFVGDAGARHWVGRGLRRPLAAVQRHGDAALGRAWIRSSNSRIGSRAGSRCFRCVGCWCGRSGQRCAVTWRARRRWLRLAFTLVEAILGALLVKLGLTAQSQSPLRRALPGAALDQYSAAAGGADADRAPAEPAQGYSAQQRSAWLRRFGAIAGVVVVMIVGVTGSLAALGDTLFPASSLGQALAQDFSAGSGWLVRWRWTHPTVAFLSSIFLIWILVRAAQRLGRPLGQSRAVRAGAAAAGGAICAGSAGCVSACAVVAADRASAGRRCAVGGAGGAYGAADAGAERAGVGD